MLCIDNKKIKVTDQKIFIGTYVKNENSGYNANIQLSFINVDNRKKGYIHLDVGFEKQNNITSFLNREYNEIPFTSDIFFEVFDTENFFDTEIKSNIIVKLKGIKDNKVEASFEVNDEFIKIKYNGFLNFNSQCNRDTVFKSSK